MPPGITRTDLGWLAGLLEGEGCFRVTKKHQPVIHCLMTDLDVIHRIQKMMRGSIYGPQIRKDAPTRKPTFTVYVSSRKAASWMMVLYSLLGDRRREQIRKSLKDWRSVPGLRNDGVCPSCSSQLKEDKRSQCRECHAKGEMAYRSRDRVGYNAMVRARRRRAAQRAA